MTKKFPRLIQEFLVPALDNTKYGDYLKWIDKEEGLFCLSWNHKNSAQWNEEDASVFVDWDKLKGHYDPSELTYFMKAKQRFRSALYKLDIVEEIPCTQKNKRLYKLHLDEDRSKPRKVVERVTFQKERPGKRKTKVPVKRECLKEHYVSEDDDSDSSQNSSSSSGSESMYWNKAECNNSCSPKRTYETSIEEPNPAKVRKVQTTNHTTPCPSTVLKESTRTNIVFARRQPPVQTDHECKKTVFSTEENTFKDMFHESPPQVDRFSNTTLPYQHENIVPVTEAPDVFVTSIF